LLALEMVLDMRQPGRTVANLGAGGKHCLQPLESSSPLQVPTRTAWTEGSEINEINQSLVCSAKQFKKKF
jgi:hypothetical protein